jgi:hypothetical protein
MRYESMSWLLPRKFLPDPYPLPCLATPQTRNLAQLPVLPSLLPSLPSPNIFICKCHLKDASVLNDQDSCRNRGCARKINGKK